MANWDRPGVPLWKHYRVCKAGTPVDDKKFKDETKAQKHKAKLESEGYGPGLEIIQDNIWSKGYTTTDKIGYAWHSFWWGD